MACAQAFEHELQLVPDMEKKATRAACVVLCSYSANTEVRLHTGACVGAARWARLGEGRNRGEAWLAMDARWSGGDVRGCVWWSNDAMVCV